VLEVVSLLDHFEHRKTFEDVFELSLVDLEHCGEWKKRSVAVLERLLKGRKREGGIGTFQYMWILGLQTCDCGEN
jgi:hypothetical protein